PVQRVMHLEFEHHVAVERQEDTPAFEMHPFELRDDRGGAEIVLGSPAIDAEERDARQTLRDSSVGLHWPFGHPKRNVRVGEVFPHPGMDIEREPRATWRLELDDPAVDHAWAVGPVLIAGAFAVSDHVVGWDDQPGNAAL